MSAFTDLQPSSAQPSAMVDLLSHRLQCRLSDQLLPLSLAVRRLLPQRSSIDRSVVERCCCLPDADQIANSESRCCPCSTVSYRGAQYQPTPPSLCFLSSSPENQKSTRRRSSSSSSPVSAAGVTTVTSVSGRTPPPLQSKIAAAMLSVSNRLLSGRRHCHCRLISLRRCPCSIRLSATVVFSSSSPGKFEISLPLLLLV